MTATMSIPSSFPVLTRQSINVPSAVGGHGFQPLGSPVPLTRKKPTSARSRPNSQAFGRLWPHGEFSLVWRKCEVEAGRGVPLGFSLTRGQLDHAVAMVEVEALECPVMSAGLSPVPPCPDSGAKSSQGTNRPLTYGRKGITRNGAKMVRAGAYLLEKEYGRGCLTFLTLTVPPLPDSSACCLAEGWGEVARQLMQHLSRKLARKRLPVAIVFVSEFQPLRAEQGRLESLHLHLVFVGRKRGTSWGISPVELKAFWDALLTRVSGYDCTSAKYPDMKRVKNSASNYLGKYMSKGATNIGPMAETWGWECIPRQWWGMTSCLRRAVKKATLSSSGVGEYLESVIDAYFAGETPQFPGFLQAIHVLLPQSKGPPRPFLVGYAGRFGPRALEDVYEIASSIAGSCTPWRGVLKSA